MIDYPVHVIQFVGKNTLIVLSLLAVFLCVSFHMASATTFTAIKSGNWADNSTWGQSPPLLIQQGDTVTIPAGISVLCTNQIGKLIAVEDSGTINLYGRWNNNGVVKIDQNGSLNNLGSFENYFGQLSNSGKINNTGTIYDREKSLLYNDGKVYNSGKIIRSDVNSGLSNFGTIINDGYIDFAHSSNYIGGVLVNNGNLVISTTIAASNSGLLRNSGTFVLIGDLLNIGRIDNLYKGRMENLATIDNEGAVFTNNGTIENRKIINNISIPPVRNSIISNLGTIDNEGVINNFDGMIINEITGTLINNYLGSPVTDQHGVINNYGKEFANYGRITNTPNALIQNAEVITNYCGGIVDNLGTITVHQIVNIQCDSIPPKITAPQDITIVSSVEVTVSLGTPTVSDNTDQSPIVTNNSTGIFPIGVTTIVWTATDHSGNVGTANQLVTVLEPNQAIERLISSAEDVGENVASLKVIAKMINDGNGQNDAAACGKLDAFYHQIIADKGITTAQRYDLVQQIGLIKSGIHC